MPRLSFLIGGLCAISGSLGTSFLNVMSEEVVPAVLASASDIGVDGEPVRCVAERGPGRGGVAGQTDDSSLCPRSRHAGAWGLRSSS